MANCGCCKKEISLGQWRYSGLCGLCDLGICQKPEEYHKLEKELREMRKKHGSPI